MQLERIGAVVRPRHIWESVDLGFSLVRHHGWALMRVWLAFFLPLSLFLLFVVPNKWFSESFAVTLLLVWWLKPLYDRILLHYFSHALFGEQLSISQMFKALPRLLWNTQLLLGLTLLRFDPARSFNLPVWQLEQQTGKHAFQRRRVLQKNHYGGAVGLTTVCVHFEWVIYLSLVLGIWLFIPFEYIESIDMGEWFFLDMPLWVKILQKLAFITTIAIIEPLYVAGGFALYLNRRTELEGWDIELAFKRIVNRLSAWVGVGMALMVFLLTFSHTPVVYATDTLPSEEAKRSILEVVNDPDFRVEKEIWNWEPKNKEVDWNWGNNTSWRMPSLTGIASFFEILLWIALAIVVAYVVYRIIQHVQTWLPERRLRPPPNAKPFSVAGPEKFPLPDDVSAAAWQAWLQGNPHLTLSLLYRGALQTLNQRDGLRIHPSATEQECVAQVRSQASNELSHYFQQLTLAWQRLAYAQQVPAEENIKLLCEQWQHFFSDSKELLAE